MEHFEFGVDHDADKIEVEWFIVAHKSQINTIQLCEAFEDDIYIITASNDHNIHLHRLSNGVFIGQFGADAQWNIHDLTAFDRRRPNYVRTWYQKVRYTLILLNMSIRIRRRE